MSPTTPNLTSLAANAVVPISGKKYQVVNLGFGHWLDNANSDFDDGNPIISWHQNSPETPNQILSWTYLTYPSSNGDTVFTLQALSTVQSGSGSVIDGRGGYVRVDSKNNKLVQGGQPQAWKLVEVSPTVYKMTPFDNVLCDYGKLVATDVSQSIQSVAANQVTLEQDAELRQQFWMFILMP